ncbi:hypothetical protein BB560_000889 [Smittium megazygosporum]|uniref:Uncharacterized protein n=1 Tax=Smittium megazygosporum TaxID=133381 RepID=A0A2T9ZJ78_9FUNG|nr:hypothetical protein BB560_000889 [Smittium megazygosporum]
MNKGKSASLLKSPTTENRLSKDFSSLKLFTPPKSQPRNPNKTGISAPLLSKVSSINNVESRKTDPFNNQTKVSTGSKNAIALNSEPKLNSNNKSIEIESDRIQASKLQERDLQPNNKIPIQNDTFNYNKSRTLPPSSNEFTQTLQNKGLLKTSPTRDASLNAQKNDTTSTNLNLEPKLEQGNKLKFEIKALVAQVESSKTENLYLSGDSYNSNIEPKFDILKFSFPEPSKDEITKDSETHEPDAKNTKYESDTNSSHSAISKTESTKNSPKDKTTNSNLIMRSKLFPDKTKLDSSISAGANYNLTRPIQKSKNLAPNLSLPRVSSSSRKSIVPSESVRAAASVNTRSIPPQSIRSPTKTQSSQKSSKSTLITNSKYSAANLPNLNAKTEKNNVTKRLSIGGPSSKEPPSFAPPTKPSLKSPRLTTSLGKTSSDDPSKNMLATIKKLQLENSRLGSACTKAKSDLESNKQQFVEKIQSLEEKINSLVVELEETISKHELESKSQGDLVALKSHIIEDLKEQISKNESGYKLELENINTGHYAVLNKIQKSHEKLILTARDSENESSSLKKKVSELESILEKSQQAIAFSASNKNMNSKESDNLSNLSKDSEADFNQTKNFAFFRNKGSRDLADRSQADNDASDYEMEFDIDQSNYERSYLYACIALLVNKFCNTRENDFFLQEYCSLLSSELGLKNLYEEVDISMLFKDTGDFSESVGISKTKFDQNKLLASTNALMGQLFGDLNKPSVGQVVSREDVSYTSLEDSQNRSLPSIRSSKSSEGKDEEKAFEPVSYEHLNTYPLLETEDKHSENNLSEEAEEPDSREYVSLISPDIDHSVPGIENIGQKIHTNHSPASSKSDLSSTRKSIGSFNSPDLTTPTINRGTRRVQSLTPVESLERITSFEEYENPVIEHNQSSPYKFQNVSSIFLQSKPENLENLPYSPVSADSEIQTPTKPVAFSYNIVEHTSNEKNPLSSGIDLDIDEMCFPLNLLLQYLKPEDSDNADILDRKLKRLTLERSKIERELARIPRNPNHTARTRELELNEQLLAIKGLISGARSRFRNLVLS